MTILRIRKFGNVLWEESEEGGGAGGFMKPKDLSGLSENDLASCNQVYTAMVTYNGVKAVLAVIVNAHWDDLVRIRPLLRESLRPRTEARDMIASDDWDTFWNHLGPYGRPLGPEPDLI